jgi:predicted secreted protein
VPRRKVNLSDYDRHLAARLVDARGRKVVFLSHCLLNENTRYLGGACRPGCVREVVEGCLAADLGIVQMPCPEQRAWGGVLKRRLLLAYGLKERHPLAYRLRRPLLALALAYTGWVYRRLAGRVAGEIADNLAAGYTVMGVAGVDGSPSCGVGTTIDPGVLDGLTRTPVSSLSNESLNDTLRRARIPGPGLFVRELQRALRRRRIAVPFSAHDLLAELDGRRSNLRLDAGGGFASSETDPPSSPSGPDCGASTRLPDRRAGDEATKSGTGPLTQR